MNILSSNFRKVKQDNVREKGEFGRFLIICANSRCPSLTDLRLMASSKVNNVTKCHYIIKCYIATYLGIK